jgi:multidrug resistance efflux pump
MIIFLTLCYIAVLAILVKLGLIRLSLWWKLSPLVWMLILLVILFLPMQWGAPAGDMLVLSYVVEIIPNVSGEVTEVQARAMVPISKGDVLFQIDTRPFEAEVEKLEASLAAAEQNVPQLEATYLAATATLEESTAQYDLAVLNYDRAVALQKSNAGAIAEIQVDQARQTSVATKAATRVAEANKEGARLAWKAEFNGENTQVAELKAQLTVARLNLEWTTVRAPNDGMVVNIFLRPGQRVANFPVRSWMGFVEQSGARIGVALPQYVLRHVEPGQPVEVVLKLYPGQTFTGTVESIAPLNSEGQIQPSGIVPVLTTSSASELRFAVIINIDDERIDANSLPGGAVGTAAIYTDNVSMTHVIRRVMVRMQTWMNYIVP